MDFNKMWNNLSTGGKIGGIAGVVLIINLFLPWYGFSGFGVSSSISAFDSGFFAWSGSLLAIAGAVLLLIAEVGEKKINLGSLQGGQLALLLAGLGTLFIILRWLTETNFVKFGLFLGIIAAAVTTYGAFMSLKASGVGLPSADDFKSFGGSGGGDDSPPPPPPPA